MTRIRYAQILPIMAVAVANCGAPARSTDYYVDFDRGSDNATGLSANEAWRHAPGDSRAGAGPRAIRLLPGDAVLFRGGVAYRGTVVVRSAGTPNAPIRYVGDAWGTEPAILDGSEPAERVRPCRSARDCGGEPDWTVLYRMSLQGDQLAQDGLFQQEQGLVPARPGEPLEPGTARPMPGSKGRTILIRPVPGLDLRFARGAARVGFLLVVGGHVEIRGFRTRCFAPAPRFGPYAGWPLVQLQPMPDIRLAAVSGSIRHAAPMGPAIAGVTSGPI